MKLKQDEDAEAVTRIRQLEAQKLQDASDALESTLRQALQAMKQQQEEEAEVMARARQAEMQKLQEASDALEAKVQAAIAEGVAKDRLEQSVQAGQERLAALQKHNDTMMAQATAIM